MAERETGVADDEYVAPLEDRPAPHVAAAVARIADTLGPPALHPGVADGAADPLADVRARLAEAEEIMARQAWDRLYIKGYGVQHAADVSTVLAALDAERAAREKQQRIASDLFDEGLRLRKRAERAEAAIARARAVRERYPHGQESSAYNAGRAAVVAALETETPGMRTPGGMWTLEPLGCRARGEPHDYASPPEGWTPPPVDLELGLVRVCTRCGAVESTLRAPS